MFDPINARFASSCSRNGIRDAEIDAIWLGATSIKSMVAGSTTGKSPSSRTLTRSLINVPSGLIGAFACAITFASSSSALK